MPSAHHSHATYEVYIIESCDILPARRARSDVASAAGSVRTNTSTSSEPRTLVSHPLVLVLNLPRHAQWWKRPFNRFRKHVASASDDAGRLCSTSYARVCSQCSWQRRFDGDNEKYDPLLAKVKVKRKGDMPDGTPTPSVSTGGTETMPADVALQ